MCNGHAYNYNHECMLKTTSGAIYNSTVLDSHSKAASFKLFVSLVPKLHIFLNLMPQVLFYAFNYFRYVYT